MGLPRTLKNFNVFIDGGNYKGQVEEITLPTLTRKMEEYRAGGMNGPVDLDFGHEKLELTFKGGGWLEGLATGFGHPEVTGVMVRFAGAVQNDETGEVHSVEVFCRGRISEIGQESNKSGEKAGREYKYSLAYYREVDNGRINHEIDIVNMIDIAGGRDNAAAIRAAIGV